MNTIEKISDLELIQEVCRRLSQGKISDALVLNDLIKTLRRLGIIESDQSD